MKQSLSVFVLSILVVGFLLADITSFGFADSTSFTVSGYIIDSEGKGISGAMIIFNVPQIVPYVYSNDSGYYEISAPAGTYQVNVWPPFDSHYISYGESGFVVGADITKDITLVSGFKVSGIIKDTYGAPMAKAVVALGNFFCGWYSKSLGRYFVTVPAGTYTLYAKPANGPQGVSLFPEYYEYNVTVNGDLTKDIIVQAAPRSQVTGYILDEAGNAVAGAKIIFGVPEVIPSVTTDETGYYNVSAPPGTYRVNVWSPFNSNYISYDEAGFTVETSDISKNITLTQGYKLSGYLRDSSGAPIRGTLVVLDNFHSGWYSDGGGYYFAVAPAGTYTLTIVPKTGPTFPVYAENGFVLTGDTVKDFNLTLSTNGTTNGSLDDGIIDGDLDTNMVGDSTISTPETPEPLPVPVIDESLVLCSDDFSADSGFWDYRGSAYRDQTNEDALFFVSSNSTVAALEFDNATAGISFTVSGPSGTTGYVEFTIAKSLVFDVEDVKLFLDGTEIDYDITSTEDSWIIYVTYAHSVHYISINLQTNTEEQLLPSNDCWMGVTAAISIALIGVSPLIYFRKRRP